MELSNTERLRIAILLNSGIVLLQIVFGILAGSLALLTDAVHNLGDVFSLLLAALALSWMSRASSEEFTFGYKRSEILAGFVNAGFLMGASLLILITGIKALLFPSPVEGGYVILFGTIGLVVNAFSAWLLKGTLFAHSHDHTGNHYHKEEEDLNIGAAYLHLLSDALLSLAVVIGGLCMYFFHISIIDPVIAIFFSLWIAKETLPLLQKGYHILMEGSPGHISITRIKEEIKTFPDVIDMHHVHLWSLSSRDIHLSGHLTLTRDIPLHEADAIIMKVRTYLEKQGITHITLQAETAEMLCHQDANKTSPQEKDKCLSPEKEQ